jgi:trans-2-enoyl-CoA reductase
MCKDLAIEALKEIHKKHISETIDLENNQIKSTKLKSNRFKAEFKNGDTRKLLLF